MELRAQSITPHPQHVPLNTFWEHLCRLLWLRGSPLPSGWRSPIRMAWSVFNPCRECPWWSKWSYFMSPEFICHFWSTRGAIFWPGPVTAHAVGRKPTLFQRFSSSPTEQIRQAVLDLVGRSCILIFLGGIYKDSFCLETGYFSRLNTSSEEVTSIGRKSTRGTYGEHTETTPANEPVEEPIGIPGPSSEPQTLEPSRKGETRVPAALKRLPSHKRVGLKEEIKPHGQGGRWLKDRSDVLWTWEVGMDVCL